MVTLPICIWQHILNYLKLHTQIRLITCCKNFYTKLYIYKINSHLLNKCTKLPNYLTKVTKLVTSSLAVISLFKNITHLECNNDFLTTSDIAHFDLKSLKLNITYENIKLSVFKNLKKLYLFGYGNNVRHLDDLNLTKLHCNLRIKNITHLTNLTYLNCANKFSNISDSQIKNMNLTTLICSSNNKITKIGHMHNLRKLICINTFIYNAEFTTLNLYYLDCSNTEISNINHMTNLRILKCRYTQMGSLKYLNLIELDAYDCPDLCNIAHMTNLKHLTLSNNKIITSADLQNMQLDYAHIMHTNIKTIAGTGDYTIL